MKIYDADAFHERVQFAADAIVRRETTSREFDTCFEMYDGDAVAAALMARSEHDRQLKSALTAWLGNPLPEVWQRAVQDAKDHPHLATYASQLRAKGQAGAEKYFKKVKAQNLWLLTEIRRAQDKSGMIKRRQSDPTFGFGGRGSTAVEEKLSKEARARWASANLPGHLLTQDPESILRYAERCGTDLRTPIHDD